MWNRLGRQMVSRRDLLRGAVLAGGANLVSAVAGPGGSAALSGEQDRFLDDLERAGCQYFWDCSSPQTGLSRDRFTVRGADHGGVASIAATGFGLTALCIADSRGYLSHPQARDRALTSLRFLWKKLPHHRGFFYHFGDMNTGERQWDSEVSSVDTAILLVRRPRL